MAIALLALDVKSCLLHLGVKTKIVSRGLDNLFGWGSLLNWGGLFSLGNHLLDWGADRLG